MPVKTTMRGMRRVRGYRRTDVFSTAMLLPDLHPWLKEYFATSNLVPIMDETVGSLPAWEAVPTQHSASSNQLPTLATHRMRQRHEIAAMRTTLHATIAAAHEAMTRRDAVTAPPPSPPVQQIIAAPSPMAYQELTAPLPAGARRSSSPTPFTIPVAMTPNAATTLSQNFLRVSRPMVCTAPAAPNFLHALQQQLATLPAAGRAALPHIHTAMGPLRTAFRADGVGAPWFAIPAPYDELLVVALVVTPLEVCWRAFGWQAWRAARATVLPLLPSRESERGCVALHASNPTRLNVLERMGLRGLPHFDGFRRLAMTVQPQWARAAAFAGVLLLVLLPVKLLGIGSAFVPEAKGRVLGAAASALGDFNAGGRALAASSFTDAIAAFDRARGTIARLPAPRSAPGALALRMGKHLPVIGAPLRTAASARGAGVALADASSAAARGFALLAGLDPTAPEARAYLRAARAAFTTARTRADAAADALRSANLPIADTVVAAAGALRHANALLAVVEGLAGLDRERRILLVFQNPAELRATGGFIGSVALLGVRDGAITAMDVPAGGAYDISGMTRMRVLPPEPLRLVTPTWQFHDANWFPDFPTSAAQLRRFAEASGWPTADAVVAIQAPFLSDVLRLTGPVAVGSHTFTADDVLRALTDTVESSAARASGAPKAVIGDLAPVLLNRLLGLATSGEAADGIALVDLMLRALDARDLQLAFTDDAIQTAIADVHWDGALRPTANDALAVIHTNIAGGKSDAVMRDAIRHDVRIAADGSATATVTVARTHTGAPPPPGASPYDRLVNLQNVDYLRLYVPRGSALLAANGFDPPPSDRFEPRPPDALPDRTLLATETNEALAGGGTLRVTEEFGRTAIGGWVLTPPGATRTVSVTIALPWRYERSTRTALGRVRPANPQPYTLLVQRQPGTTATFSQSLTLDPAWRVTWSDGTFTQDGALWKRTATLDRDIFAGAMVAPVQQ